MSDPHSDHHCGIPMGWMRVDPQHVPQFESQAAYLKRHRLLGAGELRLLTPAHLKTLDPLPRAHWSYDGQHNPAAASATPLEILNLAEIYDAVGGIRAH